MRHRYAFVSILVLAALALVVAPSYADRPAAQIGTPHGTLHQVVVGHKLLGGNTTCVLGVTGPASFPMFYLYPPNDQYYTLIEPSQCGCSGSGGVQLTNAHVMLDFPEPCAIPVEIGVVAADLTDPACPAPILGEYLCGPIAYELSGVEEPGQYEFSLSLTGGCCITQKAFLMITFVSGGDCGGLPGLMIDTSVCGCTSYNAWPDGGDQAYDLCGTLPGSPVMYADATCCSPVPVVPQTWGGLKATYR
jgi:hypothetical protein